MLSLTAHAGGPTKTMTPPARKTKISESILEELWFGEDDASAITAQAAASFAAALADLEGLRPFSEVARRVLEQVADKDFEVGRLQDIIEQDPALATKVLRLANSAAFRSREACASIKQAIMVLGSRTLSEVATSLSMMSMFSDMSGIGRAIRDHCASTGALVRALALHRANTGPNSYIVGLLHDFGKLLLIQAQPATYLKIHGNQIADADTIHLREREVLGFDHAVLGAHILSKWGLPDPVPKIVAWHHQPARAFAAGDDVALQVALVRLAEKMDRFLSQEALPSAEQTAHIASTPECEYVGFSARDLEKLWDELRQVKQEAEQIFR
jgi:putative nucleotidyltransferase with HDIG domain